MGTFKNSVRKAKNTSKSVETCKNAWDYTKDFSS